MLRPIVLIDGVVICRRCFAAAPVGTGGFMDYWWVLVLLIVLLLLIILIIICCLWCCNNAKGDTYYGKYIH